MKRNEVEKITGLTRKAILYYEDKGLIRPHKEENNYRSYSQKDVDRLLQISIYRKLGPSLLEIKNILSTKEKELASILRDRQYRLELEENKKNLLEDVYKRQGKISLNKTVDEIRSEKNMSIEDYFTEVF